jgi:uncharacterized protein YdeI (YjbR/CyaY-like superfamily)
MIRTQAFEQVEILSPDDLRAWLMQHHATDRSVWLVTHKKRPGAPFVPKDAVFDALIAFGWTDGVRRKVDEDRTMQLILPRKQQAWALSYKERAARLTAEGRMHAAGLAAVAASKAAGRWDETAAVDALLVPADLGAALADVPAAAAFFYATAPSYRRNVLRWLHLAKRAPTRSARITAIVSASARQEKLPQM